MVLPKKKPKIKLKKKPKIKGKKRKITGKDLKKGTALETPEERAERIERNRQESVAGEEHQKTDEFKETSSGIGGKGGVPPQKKKNEKHQFHRSTWTHPLLE